MGEARDDCCCDNKLLVHLCNGQVRVRSQALRRQAAVTQDIFGELMSAGLHATHSGRFALRHIYRELNSAGAALAKARLHSLGHHCHRTFASVRMAARTPVRQQSWMCTRRSLGDRSNAEVVDGGDHVMGIAALVHFN